MKNRLLRKTLSCFLAVTMIAPSILTGVLEVSAAEPAEEALVFQMDFENTDAAVGEQLPASITANTGETITVYNNVSLAEGLDGGKAVDLGFNKGYLTIPNADALNPESLTVSVWLKRYETANAEARILWAKGNSWNSNGWFLGWTTGESMALVTDGSNMAVQKGNADTLLPLSEWTNITGVFDSETGDIILYQDGSVFASTKIAGASITKAAITEILVGKSGYGHVGIGCYADDFRIYNEAMTEKEVGELAGLTEQDYLEADAANLYVPSRVSYDFSLPLSGTNGSVIT